MTVNIRPVAQADRDAWETLYRGYADFYGVAQSQEMRDRVWGWLHDPAHEVCGLVAEAPDGLIGIAHFREFARPLVAATGGFLDDLYVDPEARGMHVADQMIAAIKAEGARRGWSIIRWITAQDNYRARGVYDRLATQTAWVTYDITI